MRFFVSRCEASEAIATRLCSADRLPGRGLAAILDRCPRSFFQVTVRGRFLQARRFVSLRGEEFVGTNTSGNLENVVFADA